jgi:hypothetical protein
MDRAHSAHMANSEEEPVMLPFQDKASGLARGHKISRRPRASYRWLRDRKEALDWIVANSEQPIKTTKMFPSLGVQPNAGTHFAAPTVSAMTAPRTPRSFSGPTVESRAVWCSISELSSAPTKTTIVENHIHIISPTTAPNAP